MTVDRAISIDDLRRIARRRLPRAVFDFYDGGAEDEVTLADNRAAYSRMKLLPKVLVDISRIDTSTEILGFPAQLPIVTSPTGGVGFGWRGGDACIARAAHAFGIPYTLSATATSSIERIAAEAPGYHWFQCYMLNRPEFSRKLIERARNSGYEGLMITLDLAVGGKRERDYRNEFRVPFHYTLRNLIDFALKPRWALDMLLRGVPTLECLEGFDADAAAPASGSVQASSIGSFFDPSFDWQKLERIRDVWKKPLIRTMQLCGVAKVGDIGPDLVTQ